MSARSSHGQKILLFLAILLAGVYFFPTPAEAENWQRYYDWGPYYGRVNPVTLGTPAVAGATTPEGTPTAQPENAADISKFQGYVLGLGSNFTPDNPFYFIKTFQESIALGLTFDPAKKEEVRLQIAGERLEEIENLAERGRTDVLGSASQVYSKTLDTVADNLEALQTQRGAVEVAPLLEKFEFECAKHNLVLEEVAVKVPDAAKPAIELALAAPEGVVDRVADLAGRPALPVEVLDRIQALKAQGLLSAEEAQKLVASPSRVEAREELRKYAREGIFPEADIKKLDELARERFAGDFNKIVEMKKFFELKRLEEIKPDEQTLKEIQEFGKTYKSGDIVPPGLKRYWVPLVRLEELQNTIQPAYIDHTLFQTRQDYFQKFHEVVERVKPRPEDVLQVGKLIAQNPNAALDPFYARIITIVEKFGASCGVGLKWVPAPQTGGYCIPGTVNPTDFRPPEFKEDRICGQAFTAAKGPDGACVVFPNTCTPPGWAKVNSCAGDSSEAGKVAPTTKTCPSNSHWAPVPYMPEGGYCVPNITYPVYQPPTGEGGLPVTGVLEAVCPEKYHRNYPGGPCLPDTYVGTGVGYPTYTPGIFPSPTYPPASCPNGYFWSGTTCLSSSKTCGPGSHWVSEPSSPSGGYCAPDTVPVLEACPAGQYRGPGGYCTSLEKSSEAYKCMQAGKYWDGSRCSDTPVPPPPGTFPEPCPAGQYRGPGGYCIPSGSTSDPKIEECFRSGRFWNGTACVDKPVSGNVGTCPEGQYMGPGGYCLPVGGGGGRTACQPPKEGCGFNAWFDYSSCSCRSTFDIQPMPPTYTPPPSGYGSCPSGQYWNGSSCVSTTYTPPPTTGETTPLPTYTPPSSYTQPPSYTPPSSYEPAPSYTEPPPSYTPPSSYTQTY